VKRQHSGRQAAGLLQPLLPPPPLYRTTSHEAHPRPTSPVSLHSRPPTPHSQSVSQSQPQGHSVGGRSASPLNAYSASGASSVRSSVTASTQGRSYSVAGSYAGEQHGQQGEHHAEHRAPGLGAIQEEGSVMTLNSQGSTVRRSQLNSPAMSGAHSGPSVRRDGIAAAGASTQSAHSAYSEPAAGTPIHTLLHGAYDQSAAYGEAGADEQEHSLLDEALHKQLQSLTATNAALTARTTQLEQRLRHSELRCKLLMDQIKSMPVSLSVAQVTFKC
jgi:hypothetical protein